ncbi:dihydrofolate reductase region [Gordonia bronchialis DSM 43247]|uniref:Dihydrofolate reductase n=1 Tax=Gordonia bronchialis (strain ATCC 25592 / DSM 43247 / BCRC 13721 / JCM 3198 / KCTC 3076 / NBRC 16047 / NCTC 10667) TaxID=526226 RepID=D0LBL1_GORB4|nr:dihydrofolate reductase [Gordonia bronchialis]ACY21425.1 dihydrofolate reductase region [Gordonia bronchialis DSM 43247]MCC3324208.1 dihydrofolate reductase [Gordonia bronchialis]QGS24912.1 dihydrofolate reductase [Gordonia bronchialis]UAK38829.1 dihydrofolate reductase [Gordonia bronchialis]STQ64306.1 Dihydrofolate reductase [Gordonia bronchialis]
MPRSIVLVWAQDRAGAIGRANTIPWHVPEDMARFRQITGTDPVVMGRRTWESLPDRFRPLPRRRNIVVTRSVGFVADGAEVVHSVDAAVALPDERLVVIGGGEIYSAVMESATHLKVTELDLLVPEADAFAPEVDEYVWEVENAGDWEMSSGGVRYRFVDYRRHRAAP